jgi:myo-inositol-1(or 4)-monophosphatase
VLAARVPDDAVVGEEGDDVAGTSGRRWIVDPLDGTVNYLFGIPQWCVSVACEGLAAVVLDPVRDECFTATAEGPALLGGVPLPGSDKSDLSQALVATGFGYDSDRRALQAAVLARVLPRVRDVRRMGSAALDLAWLAAGRYDAYYEHGVKPWDTAGGELLCARAGLEVVHLPARDALPTGILAASPAIVQELVELVTA